MEEVHIFVANAPCVIQTSYNRYRVETAGQILRLNADEAQQVRSPSFIYRDYLTYLGKDKKVDTSVQAIPIPEEGEEVAVAVENDPNS